MEILRPRSVSRGTICPPSTYSPNKRPVWRRPNVGMRLPLIAFVVAKKTHAPNAVGLFENGVIRWKEPPKLIYTMADPPNILGATQCLDMLGVMSLLQSEASASFGFLGAAEVDRFGNLNSTEVRGAKGLTRLPGSGGACDIASLAHRFVVLLEHTRQRLPERVSYVTSPGNGDGPGWRRHVGLLRGGPWAISPPGLCFASPTTGKPFWHRLIRVWRSMMSWTAPGWKLRVSNAVSSTPEPNPHELKAIREYDRDGFWTK